MIVDCHMYSWKYPEHFKRETVEKVYKRFWGKDLSSWNEEQMKDLLDNPPELYMRFMGKAEKGIMMAQHAPDTLGVTVPPEYQAEIAKKYPDKFAWCCNPHPFLPSPEAAVKELERCVTKLGAIGVGEWSPGYMGCMVNDERCFPFYEKCVELDVPITAHAGLVRSRFALLKNIDMLNHVDEVAVRYPELKIVIAHFGWPKYDDTIFLMRKHANVFCNISWLTSFAGLDPAFGAPQAFGAPYHDPDTFYPYFDLLYPLLKWFSGTYGDPDKLIFASDWVGCTPAKTIEVFESINRLMRQYNLPEIPETRIYNILHENWKKVYTHAMKQWGVS